MDKHYLSWWLDKARKQHSSSSSAHLSRGGGILQRESIHKQLQGVVPHASIGCCQIPEEQRVVQPQQHDICARGQALGVKALQHMPQGRCQGRAGCPQGTSDQALQQHIILVCRSQLHVCTPLSRDPKLRWLPVSDSVSLRFL